jgi:chromosome segregation ATPase
MNTTMKIAALTLSIGLSFTACKDEEKINLLSEIAKMKTEFTAVDSSLNAIQAYVDKQEDSLVQVAASDPKRKTELDSILNVNETGRKELNDMVTMHKMQTNQLDSLKTGVEGSTLKKEEAKASLESLKTENAKAIEYADKAKLILVISAISKE